MDFPKRKHPRLKNYDCSQNGMYFITVCTKDRQPLLGKVFPSTGLIDEDHVGLEQIHLSAAGQIYLQCLQEIPAHYPGASVDCCMIMPDHIHLLLQLEDSSDGGQRSGRPTVLQIIRAFKRISAQHAVGLQWQSSFYEHIIRSDRELQETRAYILHNPLQAENCRAARPLAAEQKGVDQ